MRFLFALLVLAWYASHVQAADIIPKTLFNMNKVVSLPPTVPITNTPVVRQEWRQVQVCYGNYCRMEWRLMPVNQNQVISAPVQVYSSGR